MAVSASRNRWEAINLRTPSGVSGFDERLRVFGANSYPRGQGLANPSQAPIGRDYRPRRRLLTSDRPYAALRWEYLAMNHARMIGVGRMRVKWPSAISYQLSAIGDQASKIPLPLLAVVSILWSCS